MKKVLTVSWIFTLGLLLSVNSAHSQDTTSLKQEWKPRALIVNSGMSFYREFPMTIDDMRKIAPSSAMLQRDLSAYTPGNSFFSVLLNASSEFDAHLELSRFSFPVDHQVMASSVMVGFNYSAINFTGQNYMKNYSHRYDTLYSGNSTIYMDSVHYENYGFSWNTEAISIDISQNFHSDPRKLFSAGFGYGILVGACLNSYFYAGHTTTNVTTATSGPPGGGVWNTTESDSSEFEMIHTKSSFVANVYFPFYMQLRFSRKDNFFNHLAFTAEGRTGLDVIGIPGLGAQVRPLYSQLFGFKYYFEKSPTKFHQSVPY